MSRRLGTRRADDLKALVVQGIETHRHLLPGARQLADLHSAFGHRVEGRSITNADQVHDPNRRRSEPTAVQNYDVQMLASATSPRDRHASIVRPSTQGLSKSNATPARKTNSTNQRTQAEAQSVSLAHFMAHVVGVEFERVLSHVDENEFDRVVARVARTSTRAND